MPLTTTPNWFKVWRLLLRIVTLARTKLFKLQRQRRRDSCGRGFRQHAHAGVIVRILARRRPRVVSRIRRDAFEALGAHLGGYPVAELGVTLNEGLRHVWLDGRHVRRQKQTRTERTLLVNVMHDLRMPNVVNLVDGELCL